MTHQTQPPSPPDIEMVELARLRPREDNPRKHSREQISALTKSIIAYGFRMPVLVDGDDRLICGHARVKAAAKAGLTAVPALRASDMSEQQVRAFMIADNRLAELATWDDDALAIHLKLLDDIELDFDIESIGFEYGEIEQRITACEVASSSDTDTSDHCSLDSTEADKSHRELEDEDGELAVPERPVTRPGDLWVLRSGSAEHRVYCGDALVPATYDALMDRGPASMVFTDPPYNLPARQIGNVAREKHGDFAIAAGEMDEAEFRDFLAEVFKMLRANTVDGSIHFVTMDWRHLLPLLMAGLGAYDEFKNLCVWVKNRPGMGAFYRSQHELVAVFKSGDSAHQNNFKLGQHGRLRTNVWDYRSARSFNAADGDPPSSEALTLHPTIKPVRLIADALLDCSRRGEVVLDPFLGSGSTLIACEQEKRRCRGVELEPRYMDVALSRWRVLTGEQPHLASNGASFDEVAEQRKETCDSAEHTEAIDG